MPTIAMVTLKSPMEIKTVWSLPHCWTSQIPVNGLRQKFRALMDSPL